MRWALMPEIDKLSRNECQVAVVTNFIDRENVRMVERRGSFCLLNESLQKFWIGDETLGKDFDGHGAA